MTLRAYERGSRPLTKEAAAEIFYATFVSPDWLLDEDASAHQPKSFSGGEYSLEYYLQYFAHPNLQDEDIEESSGLGLTYMRTSHYVARMLRVAARRRKHLLCDYLIRKAVVECAKRLRLEDSFQKEIPSALAHKATADMMMGGEFVDQSQFHHDTYTAALVLSTATLFEWSSELEGGAEGQSAVLAKIDYVRAIVARSLQQRSDAVRKRKLPRKGK